METKDFIYQAKRYIYQNISTYWKKGYIDVDYDTFKDWGVSLSDISDYHFESLVWKAPFTVDVVIHTDYGLRIKAKKWRKPQSGFFIYKYYVNNELVYVGRALSPVKRFFEHVKDDRKYLKVTNFEIYKCKNKSEMLLLERLLIGEYSPPWNVVDKDNGELPYKLPEIKFEKFNLLEFIANY